MYNRQPTKSILSYLNKVYILTSYSIVENTVKSTAFLYCIENQVELILNVHVTYSESQWSTDSCTVPESKSY
jgi:hypothetical protein